MKFNFIPAPEILQDYVEYFWTAETGDGEEPFKPEITAFVHGASGIISQHQHGNPAFTHRGTYSGGDFYIC